MTSNEQSSLIKNKISDLKNQYKEHLDKYKKMISDLESDNERIITKNSDLTAIIQQNNDLHRQEKKLLTDKLHEREKQVENSNHKLMRLEDHYREIEVQNSELNQNIKLAEKRIKTEQVEIERLKHEYESEIQKLKININKVTLVANKRKEIVENYNAKNEELQKEMHSYKKEKETFEKLIQELKDKKLTLDENIRNLNIKLENEIKSKQEINNSHSILEKKLLSLEEVTKENEKLKLSINEFQKNINSLRNEIKESKFSLENALNQNKTIEQSYSTKVSELQEALTQSKVSLENALSQNKTIEQSYSTKVSELQEALTQSKVSLENALSRNRTIEQEYSSKVSELQEALTQSKISLENALSLNITIEQEYFTKVSELQEALTQSKVSLEDSYKKSQEIENNFLKQIAELNLDLKENKESYELKLDIKERKISELNKNFEAELKEKFTLSIKIDSLNKDIEDLNKIIAETKEIISDKDKDKEILISEYDKKIRNSDEHINLLRDRIDRITSDKEKEIASVKSEKETFENSCITLREELNHYKEVSMELENKILEIKEVKHQLSHKDTEIRRFAEEAEGLKELNEKLKISKKNEIERLDNEINTLITESSNLKVGLSRKELELEIAKQDVNSLKTIIENLKNNSDKSEQKTIKLENSIQEHKLKLSQKENIIHEQNSEIDEQKAKFETYSNTKEREVKKLYDEIENLNKNFLEISRKFSQKLESDEITSTDEKLALELLSEKDEKIILLEKENRKFKIDLELLIAQNKEQIDKNTNLNKQKFEISNNLNKEIGLLKDKISDAENKIIENNLINEKITQLHEQNNNLKKEIELLKDKNSKAENNLINEKITQLHEQNNNLNKEIELLKDKNLKADSKINEGSVFNEKVIQLNEQNNQTINILKKELEELKEKQHQAENKINEDSILINLLKSKQTPKITTNVTYSEQKDEHSEIKIEKEKEIPEIYDNEKEKIEPSEKTYISIDELYKTTFQQKISEDNIIHSNTNEENENDGDEDIIKKLELYKDLFNEEPSSNSAKKQEDPKVNFSEPSFTYKKPEISSDIQKRTDHEKVSRSINEQLDKVERSLNYLQKSKKTKENKLDNTIFILGGTKDNEEGWKLELEKCLLEYGLTHKWINVSDKETLKGPGKGMVFLISPNSIPFLENADLIFRNSSFPSIKHNLTNLTKLKIDIIDNFVRKK